MKPVPILTMIALGCIFAACVSAPRPQTEVTVLLNPVAKAVPPPVSVCGDAELDVANNELCDDGNTVTGDGCSATCQLEIASNNTQILPCSVDVGREPATRHPMDALQAYTLQLNDQVRAITGLPVDIFIGEGGMIDPGDAVGSADGELQRLGQVGVLNCVTPLTSKTVVVEPSTGAALTAAYQLTGMPPRDHNIFDDPLRPGVNEVLRGPVQLLPPPADALSPSISAAVSTLPSTGIVADQLRDILPLATVNVVPGTYQINKTVQLSMAVKDLPPPAGAGKGLAKTGDKVVAMQVQWTAGPDACAWAVDSCPPEKRVPPIQDRHLDPVADVIEPLKKLVADKHAAGEAITMAVFDELFNAQQPVTGDTAKQLRGAAKAGVFDGQPRAQYDTTEYLHIRYLIGDVSVHQLVTGGYVSASQGGCSCRLDAGGTGDRASLVLGVLGTAIWLGCWMRRRAVAKQ